ncbi:hypothetical protein Ahy_B06g085471 [Arachis hypogaea]|uniref:Uncharacterized protein n=1 Tax=Arachis hypogaea TaxID=3818 RepID=A0A444YUM7_ARAHY|nr:hypothetical protein Ahy_B06g085471 [Arachis hypogaea]
MATILNAKMANNKIKYERLTRQVERIAQIVDYNENFGMNPKNLGIGQGNLHVNPNEDEVVPHIVQRNQNADEVLHRKVSNIDKVNEIKHKGGKNFTSFEIDTTLGDFEANVRQVYPGVGDDLLDFLMHQKLKDRDMSLCPRCNVVFDAEATAIFEKERMKNELAHKEEQIR